MTKWNEFKTKILMLSKGEKLVLLFCFSFLVSLFPAGCIAKVFVGEWDAGLLRGFVLALTTGYGIVTALVFACAITFIIIRFSVNNTDLNATKEVDDRGVATSMAGTYGTARWMNENGQNFRKPQTFIWTRKLKTVLFRFSIKRSKQLPAISSSKPFLVKLMLRIQSRP